MFRTSKLVSFVWLAMTMAMPDGSGAAEPDTRTEGPAAITARREGDALVVLPPRGPLSAAAKRSLEERIAIVWQEIAGPSLRVEQLAPTVRASLPPDPSHCVDAVCLRALGRMSQARWVLAVEQIVPGDSEPPSLFATLYDALDGSPMARHELPLKAGTPPRNTAEELARWAAGKARFSRPSRLGTAQMQQANAAGAAVLAVRLAPGEAPSAEAEVLRAALVDALMIYARTGAFALATNADSDTPGLRPSPSHQLLIAIDVLATSTRTRHVRHHRTGRLSATLSLVPAAGAPLLFSKRIDIQQSGRARHTDDRALLDTLVRQAVDQWVAALDPESLPNLLRRSMP